MINQDIAISLICYKTDDMTDKPLAVLIDKQGCTEKVYHNIRNSRELFNLNHDYNGIPCYDITITEKEYNDRFMRLAKIYNEIDKNV